MLLLAATGCDLAAPWAVGDLLNIVSRPVHEVRAAVLAVLTITLLYVAHYTLRTAGWWVNNRLTSQAMQAIGQDVLARVQRFSAAWHADNPSGLTVRCVSRSMEAYNLLSNALFIGLLPSASILVGMTALISLRWPAVGGFLAVMALAYTALNFRLMNQWVRPANLKSNALDTALSAAVSDVVGGQAAVRSFATELAEDLRFGRFAADWRAAVVVTWDRFNYLSAMQNAILVVLQVGLLGLFIWSWCKGRASPGDVAFGVSAFLLIAGYLRSLPEALRLLRRGLDELLDAARMDNASEWRLFWRIVLPLSAPALAVLAIFSVMWRWNDFLWPMVVLNRSEQFTLQLALNAFQGELTTSWNLLLAMTVMTLLPVTVIFLVLQRYIVQGIASSGVK